MLNTNLIGVLILIAAMGYFQIRTLLRPEQRPMLIWFCVVHGLASLLAVLQTVGVQLPTPSRIVERLSLAALRLLGLA